MRYTFTATAMDRQADDLQELSGTARVDMVGRNPDQYVISACLGSGSQESNRQNQEPTQEEVIDFIVERYEAIRDTVNLTPSKELDLGSDDEIWQDDEDDTEAQDETTEYSYFAIIPASLIKADEGYLFVYGDITTDNATEKKLAHLYHSFTTDWPRAFATQMNETTADLSSPIDVIKHLLATDDGKKYLTDYAKKFGKGTSDGLQLYETTIDHETNLLAVNWDRAVLSLSHTPNTPADLPLQMGELHEPANRFKGLTVDMIATPSPKKKSRIVLTPGKHERLATKLFPDNHEKVPQLSLEEIIDNPYSVILSGDVVEIKSTPASEITEKTEAGLQANNPKNQADEALPQQLSPREEAPAINAETKPYFRVGVHPVLVGTSVTLAFLSVGLIISANMASHLPFWTVAGGSLGLGLGLTIPFVSIGLFATALLLATIATVMIYRNHKQEENGQKSKITLFNDTPNALDKHSDVQSNDQGQLTC